LFAPAGVDFLISSMPLAASRDSLVKINNIRINTFAVLERVSANAKHVFSK
jgi:hypothetical protein